MNTSKPIIFGIRRENEQRFEARVPLIPVHIQQLQQQLGDRIRFLIQPSEIRVFSNKAYQEVGVEISEDLSAADIILGVKEIYRDRLVDGKPHLVFAHVIKGQPDNMPVLQELLARRITLIDYECITDERGDRQVFFGRSAGQTGMLETLRAFGQRLTALGKPCIFSQLKPAYKYVDLAEAKQHLTELAIAIEQQPDCLGLTEYPIIFAFAGLGNVGKGALEIFDLLPVAEVSPAQLPELFANSASRGKLFKCPMRKQDILRNSLGVFNAEEYAAHPERYRSILPELLPYISVLLNCVFWAPQYPRILPQEAFQKVWAASDRRLQVIGDLSCDPPAGSVACTVRSGDIYQPVFGYQPEDGSLCEAFAPEAVTVMAVDNLSAGLPKDSSVAFSTMLRGFLPPLVDAHWQQRDLSGELPPALWRAVVTHQGHLTPRYEYLNAYLQQYGIPAMSVRSNF